MNKICFFVKVDSNSLNSNYFSASRVRLACVFCPFCPIFFQKSKDLKNRTVVFILDIKSCDARRSSTNFPASSHQGSNTQNRLRRVRDQSYQRRPQVPIKHQCSLHFNGSSDIAKIPVQGN